MVVSVTEPKLLMKMLHVTLTGGPGKQAGSVQLSLLTSTMLVWAQTLHPVCAEQPCAHYGHPMVHGGEPPTPPQTAVGKQAQTARVRLRREECGSGSFPYIRPLGLGSPMCGALPAPVASHPPLTFEVGSDPGIVP